MERLNCFKLILLIWLTGWLLFYTGVILYGIVELVNNGTKYYQPVMLIPVVICWMYKLIKLQAVTTEWLKAIQICAIIDCILLGLSVVGLICPGVLETPKQIIVIVVVDLVSILEITFLFMVANDIMKEKSRQQQLPIDV